MNTTLWDPARFLVFASMNLSYFRWDLPVVLAARALARLEEDSESAAYVAYNASLAAAASAAARLNGTNCTSNGTTTAGHNSVAGGTATRAVNGTINCTSNGTVTVDNSTILSLDLNDTMLFFWYHHRYPSPLPTPKPFPLLLVSVGAAGGFLFLCLVAIAVYGVVQMQRRRKVVSLTHHSDSDDSDDPLTAQRQRAERRERNAKFGYEVTMHLVKLDRSLPVDSAVGRTANGERASIERRQRLGIVRRYIGDDLDEAAWHAEQARRSGGRGSRPGSATRRIARLGDSDAPMAGGATALRDSTSVGSEVELGAVANPLAAVVNPRARRSFRVEYGNVPLPLPSQVVTTSTVGATAPGPVAATDLAAALASPSSAQRQGGRGNRDSDSAGESNARQLPSDASRLPGTGNASGTDASVPARNPATNVASEPNGPTESGGLQTRLMSAVQPPVTRTTASAASDSAHAASSGVARGPSSTGAEPLAGVSPAAAASSGAIAAAAPTRTATAVTPARNVVKLQPLTGAGTAGRSTGGSAAAAAVTPSVVKAKSKTPTRKSRAASHKPAGV